MASYPTSVKSFSTHAVGDLITAAESNSYHEEITAIETDLVGRQIVNVKSYGAVGDSSTDDTAAIQAAVTACNNGVVYLPKGTYRISTTVTKLYTASVSFVGDGMGVTTLLFDDTANEGIAITGASDGGDGYVTTLAANVDLGAGSFTAASGQGSKFAAGDVVVLDDSGANNGSWLTTVSGVVGDVVSLTSLSPVALTTAASALAYREKSYYLKGVTVRDLTFQCNGSTNRSYLLALRHCHAPRITRCRFIGGGGSQVVVGTSLGATITDCVVEKTKDGYDGLNFQNVTSGVIAGNTIIDGAFAVSLIGSPYCVVANNTVNGVSGRAIKLSYQSNFCQITGNVLVSDSGHLGTGIRIDNTRYFVYTGNVFHGFGAHWSSPNVDISGTVAGYTSHGVIANNVVYGAGAGTGGGMFIGGVAAESAYHVISNNIINNTNYGIMGNVSSCLISGNIIRNCAAGTNAIHMDTNTVNNVITGNLIDNSGGAALNKTGSVGHDIYLSNAVLAGTVSVGTNDIYDEPTSHGTFTMANASSKAVADTRVTAASLIYLQATNAAAATLMAGTNSLYISARSAGTSFTVATAAAGSAAGTETFNYLIVG